MGIICCKINSKYIPIFVQHSADKKLVQSQGFLDVRVVGINTPFKRITITKTGGQHGSDSMFAVPMVDEMLDESMGFFLRTAGQKTIFFAGDTTWHEYVKLALTKHKPDYIVLNIGEATYDGFDGNLIMGTNEVKKCYEFWKTVKIITVHMYAINHCICTREIMRKFVDVNKFGDRVIIPNDGEIKTL